MSFRFLAEIRSRVGLSLLERRAMRIALSRKTADPRLPPWALVGNRRDTIVRGPGGIGVKMLAEGTVPLVAIPGAPILGQQFLSRMLEDWPVECARWPGDREVSAPSISFVVPHRGRARLRHLDLTLRSLLGQRHVSCEVLVVEQDADPQLASELPSGVRYCHDPVPAPDSLFNRSSALNAGVREARGDVVVLHDGDFVVPKDYAFEICRTVAQGYEVVNLKRFIAYLNQPSTELAFANWVLISDAVPDELIANLCAGGSIAISREAYWRIGGMDAGFVGWGGEDEEFWDRCGTLSVWNWGYLPMVHLWHPSQPGKRAVRGRGQHTVDYFESCMRIPVADRIAALKSGHRDER